MHIHFMPMLKDSILMKSVQGNYFDCLIEIHALKSFSLAFENGGSFCVGRF